MLLLGARTGEVGARTHRVGVFRQDLPSTLSISTRTQWRSGGRTHLLVEEEEDVACDGPDDGHLEARQPEGRVGERDSPVDAVAGVLEVRRLRVVPVSVPTSWAREKLVRRRKGERGRGPAHQRQFSWPRKSQASASAPETQTTASPNRVRSSMRVWLRMSRAPPWRNKRGRTSIMPKRTPGVPIPKTMSAMREPQAGLMTGPWVL